MVNFTFTLLTTTKQKKQIYGKLETKASSQAGQCILAGNYHTNTHYVGGVNNYLNSNHTKDLEQV